MQPPHARLYCHTVATLVCAAQLLGRPARWICPLNVPHLVLLLLLSQARRWEPEGGMTMLTGSSKWMR